MCDWEQVLLPASSLDKIIDEVYRVIVLLWPSYAGLVEATRQTGA
jgi:hypothetical protein